MDKQNENRQTAYDLDLISVIVPVHNCERTLGACMDSILAQQMPCNAQGVPLRMEILLVDDRSRDKTRAMCEEYAAAEGRNGGIRVLVMPSAAAGGVSGARNTGLDAAAGAWLTFVDADDTLLPDAFSSMYEAMLSLDVDLISMTDRLPPGEKVNGYTFLEQGLMTDDAHVWGKLYRAGAMNGLRFPETLSIGEDMIFLLYFALAVGKERRIGAIEAGRYLYTVNPEGAMMKPYTPSYLDQMTCWREAEAILAPRHTEVSHYVYTDLAVNRVMAALLVAGKIAMLPEDQRRESGIREAVLQIRRELRTALARNGTFAALSAACKLKTLIFLLSPDWYLKLYHRHKQGDGTASQKTEAAPAVRLPKAGEGEEP